jgi:outer membrane protein TolC
MIRIKSIFHCRNILITLLLILFSHLLSGQKAPDSLSSKMTLSQCITYALANQALIKQSLIDEDITKRDIRISLSGWYPQLEFDASAQHYLQIPFTTYPNLSDPAAAPLKWPSAPNYSSSGVFSANQIIYSNNLYFSARSVNELRNQAKENTKQTRISIYVDVTKAFFDVLLTEEQLKVLDEDILRLQKNYKDAYRLYQNGLTDKIDFQRSSIGLSNAQAERRSVEEFIKAKYAVLKQSMGVVPEKQLVVSYDSTQYENEILMDTVKVLDYTNRVEYQILQSSLNLQNLEINFYKYSVLPTLSAFYNYIPQFGNSRLSGLYDKNNPSSLLGMKMTFPLFQGLRRVENLGKARLQYDRLQLGMDYLKSQINSEYNIALSQYVSNLNELRIAKKNIVIAKDIYNTVKLQYEKGIKAYLEVLVSETDLRSSELNYLNLLFRVLSSKIDLEKALGTIQIN